MSRHEYRSYSLGMSVLLILSTTIPAFAEVTNLQINSESSKVEEIEFTQNVEKEPIPTTRIINFVDASKSPQYYIDRYYNEPSYKSWFDRNYPDFTIEEAVGYENKEQSKTTVEKFMENELLPEADAASIVQSNTQSESNAEIAQIVLAVGGLGILFGAVYGVKRKVDDNSKQISINRSTIRKRIIQPIIGSNPKEIIQTRLAKGEITLEEYEKLKTKLD